MAITGHSDDYKDAIFFVKLLLLFDFMSPSWSDDVIFMSPSWSDDVIQKYLTTPYVISCAYDAQINQMTTENESWGSFLYARL